jgi:hypothetical protein
MTQAMTREATGTFDPFDPANHGKPLWITYGVDCFPQIVCAKLLAYGPKHNLLPVGERGAYVCIWGYSIYKRQPAFRTLGTRLDKWIDRHDFVRFYEDQEAALDDLRTLTRPRLPDGKDQNST